MGLTPNSDAIGFVEVSLAASDPTAPSAGTDALQVARTLGYRTIVFAHDPVFYGQLVHELVDEFVVCDTTSSTAIAAAAEGRRLTAILSFSDLFAGVAAAAAARCGLRGPNPTSRALARDKGAVRAALSRAGLPNPRWWVINGAVPRDVPWNACGYVLKPVDGSASKDVRRVTSSRDLRRAVEEQQRRADWGRGVASKGVALLEEELLGPLYSVEGFVVDGQVSIWAYTDRKLSLPPWYVEVASIVSHEPPGSRPAADGFVEAALDALDYRFGPFHLELIETEDGPRLVELNPRLIGGGVHRCLDLATGTSSVERILRPYVDMPAAGDEPTAATAASALHRFFAPHEGTVQGIHGLELARATTGIVGLELRASLGSPAYSARENGHALGHVVALADTGQQALAACETAIDKITIEVAT